MDRLDILKSDFFEGKKDKAAYIDQMYRYHAMLFEYARFISNTNISAIEITDGQVIMTFRDSGIRFICVEGDRRLAPFDTLNFNTYEVHELEMQRQLIGEHDIVLDIGANFGWYALHIAGSRPGCRILSFEPIPSSFSFLNRNIELNGISNIETFNFGFSDQSGTVPFYFDKTLSVNAGMANHAAEGASEEISCRTETLDAFLDGNQLEAGFVKCDVEGAELKVFRGGVNMLRHQKPIIFAEMLRKWAVRFGYHPNDMIRFLHSYGYLCCKLANGNLHPMDSMDENTRETNFFFLHKEKHAELIRRFVCVTE